MTAAEVFTSKGEIKCITFDDDEGGFHQVGTFGVTKITVELVNGPMAEMPWFAVWKGDKCDSMWNAAKVEGVMFKRTDGR